MKRYVTTIAVVIVIAALSVYYLMSGKTLEVAPSVTNETTGAGPVESQTSAGSETTRGSSSGGPVAEKYRDGTYTGNVVDAFYGNVQVEAVIKNGKITDVIFLQHPSERDRSVLINGRAMPLLTAQAITAQSAKVDGVTGASATSAAFKQSLDSALLQAVEA